MFTVIVFCCVCVCLMCVMRIVVCACNYVCVTGSGTEAQDRRGVGVRKRGLPTPHLLWEDSKE